MLHHTTAVVPDLQSHDLFISLIQSCCERYHDVPLFEQQLLVLVHLGKVLLNHLALSFKLTQP